MTRGGLPRGRQTRHGVRPDDAILGALAGLGVVYFVLTPHAFPHPLHWAAAGAAGVVGGTATWLYAVRPWNRLGRRSPLPEKERDTGTRRPLSR